jgi:hypothetical protein
MSQHSDLARVILVGQPPVQNQIMGTIYGVNTDGKSGICGSQKSDR